MLDVTFSLKGLKTIILQTTNTSQHAEFFHSLIFFSSYYTYSRTFVFIVTNKCVKNQIFSVMKLQVYVPLLAFWGLFLTETLK